MPSTRYNTATAFIDDFSTLDIPTMLSRRTEDCIHSFLPTWILPTPKDNDAFAKHITGLREAMPKFPVTAQEVMEDEEKNMAIVYATSEAQFHEELKDDGIPPEEWRYQGTYIFMLTMNESGDKIKKIVEFVDSKGTDRLRALISRVQTNRAKLGMKAN